MPLLEVTLSQAKPPSRVQKQAFAEELRLILGEELATRPSSLRLIVNYVREEDTLAVLEPPADQEPAGP